MPGPHGAGERRIAVEAREVTKVFGQEPAGLRALDNVSIAIRENEFFTLLGPSGCGKTTLLRLIAGFEYPDRRRDPARRRGHRPPAAQPAAGQHGVPELCAVSAPDGRAEHRLRPRRCSASRKAEIDARVVAMLQAGAAWRSWPTAAPARFRAASSSAWRWPARWRRSPKVLLLDEPLSALDYKLRKEMQIELKRLQHETGITFVFVTHDQEEALTMSDRIAVMSSGQASCRSARRATSTTIRPTASSPTSSARPTSLTPRSTRRWRGDRAGCGSGRTLAAERRRKAVARAAKVTVVVRPEHATHRRAGDGADSPARSTTSSISAPTPMFHVRLHDGELFIVRAAERGRGDRPASRSASDVGVALRRRRRPGAEGLTGRGAQVESPMPRRDAGSSAAGCCQRRRCSSSSVPPSARSSSCSPIPSWPRATLAT